MHTRTMLVSILERLTKLFNKSPRFRETFSKDVMQPIIAHSAFGASLRTIGYWAAALFVTIFLMNTMMCVLVCMLCVQVSRIITLLSVNS